MGVLLFHFLEGKIISRLLQVLPWEIKTLLVSGEEGGRVDGRRG
jgi:hypothetical protein